jgi:hypothetical protein
MLTGEETTEPPLLLACTVKVYAPPTVGVPERTPVVGFSVKPVGNVPLATLYVGAGKPDAAKV